MNSEENERLPEIDWAGLRPPERDRYQDYVFIAHVFVGVLVSVSSFPGDLLSWDLGIGLLLPTLIALTGLAFLLPTSINWYQDEYLPFVDRFIGTSEEEKEQFLKFERIYRFTILVSGYLTTATCMVVWNLLIAFFSPFWVDLSPALDPQSGLIVGVVLLFIFLMLIFMAFFEFVLRSIYPDSLRLSKLETSMIKATKKTDDDQET
ncbi:MAG: hypothetical protein ACFFE3_06385 [Candidatus Thorarchaeota archaeon]